MQYLSLLFGLKWKLLLRRYQRNSAVLVGVIVMIVILAPMACGLAIATGFGYALLPQQTALYLLRAVLFALYLLWLLAPIFGFALNESYDITKLFLYPISPRQIFLGALLGSVLDMPTLLTLPFLGAMCFEFSKDLASALLLLVILAMFLCHTLALSQTILLLCTSALRSRRWRDVMMILAPLLGLLWFLLTQVAPRYAGRINWNVVLNNRLFMLTDYLPCGFAYQAIGAAGRGAWMPACAFLLLLTAVTVGTVYLAGYLVVLVSTGDTISAPATTRHVSAAGGSEHTVNRQVRPSLSERYLPPVVAAIADKEMKYFFRDPFFKMTLMNSLYICVMFAFLFLSSSWQYHAGFHLNPGVLWIITGSLLFGGSSMLCNIFGSEGHAATTLFQFPSSRRQIILGKNLVLFVAFMLENLLLLVPLALLVHHLELLPLLLLFAVFAMLIFTAMGNLLSIWYPHRLVMRGWRMQSQSAGQGCTGGLIYLAAFGCSFLLMLPPAAALIVPWYWLGGRWLVLTLPLALLYSAGLYLISLHLAEAQLRHREIEIIGKLTAEE